MAARLQLELPKSLSAAVEERIRDAIVNAELNFGAPLTEDGSVFGAGVSRTPIREALTRLETQGLVVIVPKRGTFVFSPSVDSVQQLAAFRVVLETTGAGLSLAHQREHAMRTLTNALSAMDKAMREGDGKAYCRADTAFHDSFFSGCGNAYLVNAFHTISWQIAALRAHLMTPRLEHRETSLDEHRGMLSCFENPNPVRLMELLQQHIMRSAAVYAEELSNRSAGEA